ncbi:hypothetical protein H7F15_09575 [Pontibacter sp. Tf4]|uniref:Ig-like domain-containing protein n=1 Tax=Pontibacter sp. Tf4 TaxID=2761620 RepID=UPI0016297F6B|nr:hypothetical protein [Pontibacter sp. Tf4]MBB6611285.1 hypothetical protein [Pontibacter sp. Tf4]
MKNFDNYACITQHLLKTHWQRLWLVLLLFAVPGVLNANYVSVVKSNSYSSQLLLSKSGVRAALWSAMNLATPKAAAAAYDGGDFSLDFVAAAPYTYNHATGGGAFDDRTIGVNNDVVESLEGGDFTCGDIVTFLTQITVADDAVGAQTIELDYEFLADATGQPGVALGDIVGVQVNYGDVGGDGPGGTDAGIVDDGGSTATLTEEQLTGPLFQNGSKLLGTVKVDDLEAGEKVVLRIDVRIECDPGSKPTGNLQAAISAGLVIDPSDDVISVGNQTVPFKNVNQIIFPTCDIIPDTAVCSGATTQYTASSDVADATYLWSITGNGTIVGAAGDGTKTITATGGATSTSVQVLAGAAGTYTLSVKISKQGYGDKICSQTITVNAIPAAPTVTVVDNCDGTSTLTASNYTGSLLWSNGATTATITVQAAGTYTVTQTVNGCTSAPGSGVAAPGTTPNAPGTSPVSYCVGETAVALTATGTNLLWYTAPTGGEGSATAPVPSTATATTLTYYVTQTVGNCESPRAAIVVTINPNPVATASVTGKLTCSVRSVTLSGSADIAVTSYSWTGPNDFTSTAQNPSVMAPGTYTLTVETAAGCTDTDQVVVEEDKDVPTVTAGTYGPVCVDAAAITLGGTPAGGTWTGTSVTAVNGGYQFNPATAGVGSHVLTYTVVGENGCEGSATATIVVNGLPAAYTLTGGAYCTGATPAGAAVTLADSDTGINYQLQINNNGTWTNVTNAMVAGTGAGISFGIQPAGTYRVLATNATTGCDDTFGNATVIVNPLPEASASVSGKITCDNPTVTISGSSDIQGAVYTWVGPTGAALEGQQVAVGMEGTYTLTVTNPETGCSNTATVQVTKDIDVPHVTVQEYGRICIDAPAFTLAGTPAGGVWTGAGVTAVNGGYQFNPATAGVGLHTLTYTVTGTNGCVGTATTTIRVIDLPTAYTLTGGHYCQGATPAGAVVTLADSENNVDYQLQVLNGAVWTNVGAEVEGTGSAISFGVQPAGRYRVVATTDKGGCDNTFGDAIVKEEPRPVVDAGESKVLTCDVQSVRLRGTSNMENVTFAWTTHDGNIVSGANSAVAVVNAAGTYVLTVTNNSTGCSASDEVVVRERTDLPNVDAGATRTLTCKVTSVQLQGTSTTENVSYLWTTTDGNIVSGATTLTPVVNEPGTYVLTVTHNRTGCSASDAVVVNLNDDAPNVAAMGGTLDCVTGTVQLTGSSTTANVSYSWTGPDGTTYNEQNPTVNMAGTYTLTVTNNSTGCSATATATVLPAQVVTRTEVTCYEIDFEQDDTGLITSTMTNAGLVQIVGQRRTPEGPIALGNHAAIFNSEMPTGDDEDLYTPDWGKVLIINQDRTNVPNDNQWGGVLELDFSAFGPVTMTSLRALDIDEYEDWSWVVLYDGAGNELYRVQLQPLGNNSKQIVDLGNTEGVMKMRVYLDGTGVDYVGSGAIDEIKFCITREVEEPCVTPEPEPSCYIADFNQDEPGLITSTTTNAGEIGILGRRRTSDGPIALGNHAAIFNTGMPTGDDEDLYTEDWGNVLIINQDRTNVPNDNQWGGILELDFSAFGPVTLYSLKALDIDEYEDWSWVKLYDGEGNELYSVQLKPLGNNSKQIVDLGATSGVMLMKVYLDGTGVDYVGSGAIDDISFCIDSENVALQTITRASALQSETAPGIEATAYPMPFADRTTLEFTVAESQEYVVQLFDSKGQLVRELKAGNAAAGERVSVEVDGAKLSDGLYFANIVCKSGLQKSVKLLHRK